MDKEISSILLVEPDEGERRRIYPHCARCGATLGSDVFAWEADEKERRYCSERCAKAPETGIWLTASRPRMIAIVKIGGEFKVVVVDDDAFAGNSITIPLGGRA